MFNGEDEEEAAADDSSYRDREENVSVKIYE